MFGDNHDSPIGDYNDNGDEEIFKGSAKDVDWQMENNYETENDDPIDNARANVDSNDTFVIARTCRNSVQVLFYQTKNIFMYLEYFVFSLIVNQNSVSESQLRLHDFCFGKGYDTCKLIVVSISEWK